MVVIANPRSGRGKVGKELGEVAQKLDTKYASQGIRVIFCDEVYQKAQGDYEKWLAATGRPSGGHAGIMDTSEMLYLGGDLWVRKELIKTALGDPVRQPGQPRDSTAQRVNNGATLPDQTHIMGIGWNTQLRDGSWENGLSPEFNP